MPMPGLARKGHKGSSMPFCGLTTATFSLAYSWKRFGTPVSDAGSGTEHKFQRAYDAWKQQRRPHIMMYFNQRAYTPKTKAEAEQWTHVLAFPRKFSPRGVVVAV